MAVVVTVAFLAAAAASMAGTATSVVSAGNSEPSQDNGLARSGYFVDRLFRSDHPATADDSWVRAEAGRIFAHTLLQNDAASPDSAYLAQLVTAKTGLAPKEAEKRVSEILADAGQVEDTARKATAHLLLWIFLALLIGAFCASYAATFGGRQRDHVKLI